MSNQTWDDEGYEARMAERARERARRHRLGDDADLVYGELTDPLPPEMCRYCWGDAYRWGGNTRTLLVHRRPGFDGCDCGCHDFEVWMASVSVEPPDEGSYRDEYLTPDIRAEYPDVKVHDSESDGE